MSWDYMEQRGKDGQVLEEDEGTNTTLLGIDRESKWISAIVVKKKGPDTYTIEAVGEEISNSGVNKVIITSDEEPAISELLQAVKKERTEQITWKIKDDPGKVPSGWVQGKRRG